MNSICNLGNCKLAEYFLVDQDSRPSSSTSRVLLVHLVLLILLEYFLVNQDQLQNAMQRLLWDTDSNVMNTQVKSVRNVLFSELISINLKKEIVQHSEMKD